MFWAGLLRAFGVLPLAKTLVRRRGAIVLTFHRVLSDDELAQTASLPGMVVRRETFSAFLKYAAEHCQFLDLRREPDWQRSTKLKLAVTFDDGWFDNATSAHPIAREHRAPMVIFIVPEKTGAEFPFWPERAVTALDESLSTEGERQNPGYIEQTIETLKGLTADKRNQRIDQMASDRKTEMSAGHVDRTMTWEQIAQLRREGVTFGSHTSTHEILTAIPIAQAEIEIAGSRERIEEKLGGTCDLFAYPNGDCSTQVRESVQRAGYKLAFLNQDPGVWTERTDRFSVPRVNVCEYHLVDESGNFSPLIFEYAVVWSAAKGLMATIRKNFLRQLRSRFFQSLAPGAGGQSGKKQLEKSS
ncbi:MAG TPA: polysaccharide deacetylase family protein [Candidatus Angelobacter sp.]|nr:polysaccharide deacetylase family protein [Candidatus Angelobacter sp.]